MRPTVTEFRYRIGAALQRAAVLDERLSSTSTAAELTKTVDEVRKLVRQLQASFEDLTQAMSDQLRAKEEVDRIRQRGTTLFRLVPTPCIATDRTGVVIDMNPAAAALLNTAPRFVAGRQFCLFVDGNRPDVLRLLQDVQRSGDTQQLAVTIRPRERAPLDATLLVAQNTADELLLVVNVQTDGTRISRRGRPHIPPTEEV
jgi:PAS domain-containing protein